MSSTLFNIPSLNINLGKTLPKKGSLAQIPAYVLIMNCFQNKFTGRIIFENKKRIKHVYFNKGELENIYSNLQDESFKTIVFKKKLINEHKLKNVVTKLDEIEIFRKDSLKNHHEQAKYLLNIKSEDIDKIERHICLEKLLDLLGWFQGDYLIQDHYKNKNDTNNMRYGVNLEILYKNLQNYFLHALPLFEYSYKSPNIAIEKFSKKNRLVYTSISKILSSLSYYSAKGCLTLNKDDFIKKVFFKEGNITHIESNKKHEALLTTLLRWNFIPKNLESVVQQQSSDSASFEKKLIEQNILSEEDLNKAKVILKFEQYLQLFHWKIGTYHFEGDLHENDTNTIETNLLHAPQSTTEELKKYLLKLHSQNSFLLFKENISSFKALCKQENLSCKELPLKKQDDLTLQENYLLSDHCLNYFIWDKWHHYLHIPKKLVCIFHKDIHSNLLLEIQYQIRINQIENLGFFTLA